MHGFTPSPILTTPATPSVPPQPADLVPRNLRFARALSLRTSMVVTVFRCRLSKFDCGLVILFNQRSARRHGHWKLTELASFKLGEPLPAVEVVAKAAS